MEASASHWRFWVPEVTGSQGVRGSNPLSSTIETPAQRWFLLYESCVQLGACHLLVTFLSSDKRSIASRRSRFLACVSRGRYDGLGHCARVHNESLMSRCRRFVDRTGDGSHLIGGQALIRSHGPPRKVWVGPKGHYQDSISDASAG